MPESRRLSLAITHYNRYPLLLKSFAEVVNHPMIDEIVIVDDHSTDEHWKPLSQLPLFNPNITVIRNDKNEGMLRNKYLAVAACKNDWVVLFDSDNVVNGSYLDALPQKLQDDTIYMPEFARPNFNYTQFAGMRYDKNQLKISGLEGDLGTMFNTCNYVVPRHQYCDIWQPNPLIKGTDTLWFNYLWLKAGYSFYVCPGMQYDHLVHDKSEWLKHSDYNLAMHRKLVNDILCL
jgi:glycosyltransferase involved in cell wall biosynthesis